MKNLKLLMAVLFFPIISFSQSLSPQVVSSAGGYFEGNDVSLSWTLGEVATETFTNGNIILTQGFQQPFTVAIHGIDLDILVFLEGPTSSGSMNNTLKDQDLIPLDQPYNVAPWNYEGTESVASIPDNVVDWVLIEVRDASSASDATSGTWVETQAAFLLNNGSVVALDGSSVLQFTGSFYKDPYIVVWHRNHLGIISSNSPVESGGIYTYDFSDDISKAHGGSAGFKLVDTGIYGMVGGDINNDGQIDATDKSIWASHAGTSQYHSADINFDAQINNPDKNDVLLENGSHTSQVPE